MNFVPDPALNPHQAWILVAERMMESFDTECRDEWVTALNDGGAVFTAVLVARDVNENALHPVMMAPCFPDFPALALQVFGSERILKALGVVVAQQRAAGNENMLPTREGYTLSGMGIALRQCHARTRRISNSFLLTDVAGNYFARRYMGTDHAEFTHVFASEDEPEHVVEDLLNNDPRLDIEHMGLGNILWSAHADPEECRQAFGYPSEGASLTALLDALFDNDDDPYHPLHYLRMN